MDDNGFFLDYNNIIKIIKNLSCIICLNSNSEKYGAVLANAIALKINARIINNIIYDIEKEVFVIDYMKIVYKISCDYFVGDNLHCHDKKMFSLSSMAKILIDLNFIEDEYKFINEFKAETKMEEIKFETTEDFVDVYNNEGDLHSCMTGSRLPSFYNKIVTKDKNPICKMLVAKRGEKIVGRAIIWDLDYFNISYKGNLINYKLVRDEKFFIDRIYPSSNNIIVNLFKNYAKENKCLMKGFQQYDKKTFFMSPSINSEIISLTLEVDCNLIKVVTEMGEEIVPFTNGKLTIPYIDTFTFLNMNYKLINNSSGCIKSFDGTNGIEAVDYYFGEGCFDDETRKLKNIRINYSYSNSSSSPRLISYVKSNEEAVKNYNCYWCPHCGRIHSIRLFNNSFIVNKVNKDGFFSVETIHKVPKKINELKQENYLFKILDVPEDVIKDGLDAVLCEDCFNELIRINKKEIKYYLCDDENYNKFKKCAISNELLFDDSYILSDFKNLDNNRIINYVKRKQKNEKPA